MISFIIVNIHILPAPLKGSFSPLNSTPPALVNFRLWCEREPDWEFTIMNQQS